MAQSTSVYVDSVLQLPQASTVAKGVDDLYGFMWNISLVSFVLTLGMVIYFMFKYRRTKKGHTTVYITENHLVEFIWTAIPTVFLAIIFIWGWRDYAKMRKGDPNAIEINIVGKQWLWETTYHTGKMELNAVHIPRGKPIRLIMTSSDVLHDFFIPAFRVKQDVVPGTFTMLNFVATDNGVFQVYCAEYCGASHSGMLAKMTVMDPADWDRWVEGMPVKQAEALPAGKDKQAKSQPVPEETKLIGLAEQGKQIFNSKACVSCHSAGTPVAGRMGPNLRGVFGSQVTLADGKKVLADENYIRESMMDPQSKVTAGFPAIMPTFRGVLKDNEVNALVAYIKALKEENRQ